MSFPLCWAVGQLNPSDNQTGPKVSLSHDAPESSWRWKTFKGLHNLLVSPTVEITIVFHQNGGLYSQGVTVDTSAQLCPLSRELVTSRQAWLQGEGSLTCSARKHSKFNAPELSVKVGQLSICLSLCSFHGCLFCFISAHVLFYRLL